MKKYLATKKSWLYNMVKCTECHWTVHFKVANFVLCEFHLNKQNKKSIIQKRSDCELHYQNLTIRFMYMIFITVAGRDYDWWLVSEWPGIYLIFNLHFESQNKKINWYFFFFFRTLSSFPPDTIIQVRKASLCSVIRGRWR